MSTTTLTADSDARATAYNHLRAGALAGTDVPNLDERDRDTLAQAALLAERLSERALGGAVTLTAEQQDAAREVALHYGLLHVNQRLDVMTTVEPQRVFRAADDTRTYGYLLMAAQEGAITPEIAPQFIATAHSFISDLGRDASNVDGEAREAIEREAAVVAEIITALEAA